MKQFVSLDETTLTVLKHAVSDLNLSSRAHDRILKVARTIAGLPRRDGGNQEDVCLKPFNTDPWTANSGLDAPR